MEQFEQLLTCAICLDRYRNPKLLPCQHSFCMEPCMDGLVDYVRRQVKCPECRAEHRIPYQGVQAFPTNVTLQRFLELHIEITGELPDPTSGQTMERCGVCSEKSYCSLCVHCEKKCCPECKDAHMDILRREITRINSQIRRGLHRLQDALALVEKNTLGLQTNCASVAEEVDEIYRRLSKALKDRTEYLRNEVDRYLGTELRGLIQLKENLELEIANIQSNCDLAEAHINENVPWDDAELLDTKELFLRTVEFIRNFEYEAGDYSRRVRFVMAHDPNQLVLHVAGYGELNIKPESGSGGLLGSSSSLAPPGGSPGLMRSKSDHRLASQYRQQEEERLARNRYVPEYEYDAPEYEAPRNKSRYRSRFMRHRDGDDSDGDSRSTVRFTSTPQEPSGLRERVLDTEDAARGPLSGIFRLTDSPRVMKKLQECERASKRKKEEPAPQPVQQPQPPKPQVQVRKAPTAMARQTSEDDEISRIKKQNKNAASPVTETVEERQPVAPSPVHPPPRELPPEREPEEPVRRPTVTRRTSVETHTPAARSASSDSSTGSESSAGSGIRSTGAPFTAEEMKQKYLSRAPPPANTAPPTPPPTVPAVATTPGRDSSNVTPSRSFQSRFLGNRAAPPPPSQTVREEAAHKKKEEEDDDDEETSSSSEETESETEEESETDVHASGAQQSSAPSTPQDRQRNESAMARTDIGPLLARSAEARRGSKEDSPSTRYSSPRGSPALSVTSPTTTTTTTTTTPSGAATLTSPGGYTSRFVVHVDHGQIHQVSSNTSNPLDRNRFRTFNDEIDESSSNRVEDKEIADYSFDDETASRLKAHSNTRSRTDVNTYTDETNTSSSSPSVSSPETLKGSDKNGRVENGKEVADQSGRSGNDDVTSSSTLRRTGDRVVEERYDAPSHSTGRRETANGSDTWKDDRENDRALSSSFDKRDALIKTSESKIQAVSKNTQLVPMESSSESETESNSEESSSDSVDTEEEDEVQEEEREEDSKDENSNVRKEKAGEWEKDNTDGTGDSLKEETAGSERSDESTDTETERGSETTATTARSNGEKSAADAEYDANKKRRGSAAVTGEKSIEELFDDNGWVVSDQDLQYARMHGTTRQQYTGNVQENRPVDVSGNREVKDLEETKSEDDVSDMETKIMESPLVQTNADGQKVETKLDPLCQTNENLPRSRVYRQSNIGKNGWLISDESDSESDRATSPVEKTLTSQDMPNIQEEVPANEESADEISGSSYDTSSCTDSSQPTRKVGEEKSSPENLWNIDDNGWVILNAIGDTSVGKDKEEQSMESTSTIRSQTTDRVVKANVENGALVANATQLKESKKSDEHEDATGVNAGIPMRMVTTVFCVSVLCYSVLINLFL